MNTSCLINGELHIGRGAIQAVRNPATAQVITEISCADPGQVDEAVQAARAAFSQWSTTPPMDRARMLLGLAEIIERNAENLARTETLDVGKPLSQTRNDELPATIDALRFYAGAARCVNAPAANEYQPGLTSFVRRDPIGVVAAIVPWNYPLMTAIWKLAPALAAGNTIVLKASEITPLTALMLAEYCAAIFPPGVVNILAGDGPNIGNALIRHDGVDMIALTGSVATGRKVLEVAAQSFKKTHLELGGNAPVIVLDDANLEDVVSGLRFAGFTNAGQDCTAAGRVYAQKGIYDRLVAMLGEAASNMICGSPLDENTDMGPLVSETHRKSVADMVERAAKLAHVEVVTGGSSIDDIGFFFEPTVLANVGHNDEICRSEVFGPVLTLTPFDEIDTAINMANDSRYGLVSSVWTENITKAFHISNRLRAGVTSINTHSVLLNEMPHSGTGQSGYGVDLSTAGLDEYSYIRHICFKHS